MGRQAPAGAKLMEMSQKNQIQKSVNDLTTTDSQLNPLLLSLKEKGARNLFGKDKDPNQNAFLNNVFGKAKTRTKKEIQRDKKVEALLEAFKKQDEDVMRKEHERDETKKRNQKALLDKFGFSDEEEDQQLQAALGGAGNYTNN